MPNMKIFNPFNLEKEFIEKILWNISDKAELVGWEAIRISLGDAILSKITSEFKGNGDADQHQHFVGLIKIRITYADKEQNQMVKDVIVKSKLESRALEEVISQVMKPGGGDEAAKIWLDVADEYIGCTAEKEVQVQRLNNKVLKMITPEIYHTVLDKEHNVYLVVMEDLRTDEFILHDSVRNVEWWGPEDIDEALDGIAMLHAAYMNKIEQFPDNLQSLFKNKSTIESFRRRLKFINFTFEHNKKVVTYVYSPDVCNYTQRYIDSYQDVYNVLAKQSITFVHGDFEIRNLCLRRDPPLGKRKLCAYDWEVASFDLPHMDLVRFIMYALPANASIDQWEKYSEMYRKAMIKHLKNEGHDIVEFEKDHFQYIFQLCVCDMFVDKFSFYNYVEHYFPNDFFARVRENIRSYFMVIAPTLQILKEM